MELLTFLAADYANIAQGGKINVMGIFRTIYAKNFPARHSSMFLVVKFGVELGELGGKRALTIKLLDADGKEIFKYEAGMEIRQIHGGLPPEVNAIIQINDIIFPIPGRYRFSVEIDGEIKGHLSLEVVQRKNKN